jgi:hypothetical protein
MCKGDSCIKMVGFFTFLLLTCEMVHIYVLCANIWIPVDINEQYHYMDVENVPKYDVSNSVEKFAMYERYIYVTRRGALKSYVWTGNQFQIQSINTLNIENITQLEFYKRRESLQDTDILKYFTDYSIRRSVANTVVFSCDANRGVINLNTYDILLFTNFTQLFHNKTSCIYKKNEIDKSMVTLNCTYHPNKFRDNLVRFLGVKRYALEPKPFMRDHRGARRAFERSAVQVGDLKKGVDKNSIVIKINNGNYNKYNSLCIEWKLTIYISIPTYITHTRSDNVVATFHSPIFCNDKNKPSKIATGRKLSSVTSPLPQGEYRNISGFSSPKIRISTREWTENEYDFDKHLLSAHTFISIIIVLISLTIAIIGVIWWLSFKLIKQVKNHEQYVMDYKL